MSLHFCNNLNSFFIDFKLFMIFIIERGNLHLQSIASAEQHHYSQWRFQIYTASSLSTVLLSNF